MSRTSARLVFARLSVRLAGYDASLTLTSENISGYYACHRIRAHDAEGVVAGCLDVS